MFLIYTESSHFHIHFLFNIQVGETIAVEIVSSPVPKDVQELLVQERFPHWREHDVSWDEGQNQSGCWR